MKKRKIFKYKAYSHFDDKKNYMHWLNYIKNPKKIEEHGFYPFIHFNLTQWKYDKNINDTKIKTRDINYSAHIDRYIYEYYNDLLNKKYNEYALGHRLNQCVVAYRNNINKNNITIAKDIFDFIKSGKEYYILVADFTKYFDKIDHKYLKSTLCEVLGYEKLPNDWYKVFRSVTKFSFIDLNNIAEYKGKTLKEIRKTKKLVDVKQLHELKKYLNVNKNGFGIPQGSSISATLANVNLIHYDTVINDYVTSKNGIYRRYCDDSIIVIPITYKGDFSVLYDKMNKSIPGLEVNDEKKKEFIYRNNNIYDMNHNNSALKYLGFEYDGKNIKIREKTITNFFLKAYRSIKFINAMSRKYRRNADRKNFFISFTHIGKQKSGNNKGNFLTYVDHCSQVMSEKKIKKQVSCHWKRFSRRLIKYS
jgi:hypothetical protein